MSKEINELKNLSVEALSDALDILGIDGCIFGLEARSMGEEAVGQAFTVNFFRIPRGQKTEKAADYIEQVNKDEIVVIDNQAINDCTVWGGILTEVASRKKLAGTLINGACRDATELKRKKYPVFSKSVYIRTGKNRVALKDILQNVKIDGIKIRPGDYIKAAVGGTVVVPKEKVWLVINQAKEIEKNENRILESIRRGMDLKKAREKYHYNFKMGSKND